MRKSILNRIKNKLDQVDANRDDDWVLLGERLLEGIFEDSEYAGAFSDKQQMAIIAVCRETYYAASLNAKKYAYTAASEALKIIDQSNLQQHTRALNDEAVTKVHPEPVAE